MNKLRGATLLGSLFTIALIICAGIVLMKTIPVYLEHMEVAQSIKSLSKLNKSILSGDEINDAEILKQRLNNQLSVNSLDHIKFDTLSIESLGGERYRITVGYQVTKPLFANISLLFNFNNAYEVTLDSK